MSGRFAEHIKGEGECEECWAGHPIECDECGGRKHAEFEDEDWDNVYLAYWCENCGSTDRQY